MLVGQRATPAVIFAVLALAIFASRLRWITGRTDGDPGGYPGSAASGPRCGHGCNASARRHQPAASDGCTRRRSYPAATPAAPATATPTVLPDGASHR